MNTSTRLLVAIFGTLFGISGMSHGLFEILQGNTSTDGMFISAIGEAQKMWPHGNEYALTLIPNFLITGMAAMAVGLAVLIWSIGFVHKKNGPAILLILFIVLLLVGGGVAQILFFPLLFLVATRINRPLTWWQKVLPSGVRKALRALWIWALAISSTLLLCVLVMAITGYVPGISDPESVLSIMLVCLCAVLLALPLAVVSGFAKDITAKENAILGNKGGVEGGRIGSGRV